MKDKQNPVHIPHENSFIFPFKLSEFTNISLAQHSAPGSFSDERIDPELVPEEISINSATFINPADSANSPGVAVIQQENQLIISCTCENLSAKLCTHQYQSLYNLLNRDELRIFFDDRLRHEKLIKFAADYGLEHEDDLDKYFTVSLLNHKIKASPKNASLFPVTKQSLAILKQKLLNGSNSTSPGGSNAENSSKYIILKQHKYYRHLYIELIEAQTTKEGKLKNPFTSINPLEEIWETEDPDVIKFFSALSRFQNNIDDKKSADELTFLNAIISNPLGIPVYMHNSEISENISAASVYPVELAVLKEDILLEISNQGQFYELSGRLKIDNKTFAPGDLLRRFNFFLQVSNTFYLVRSAALLALIDLFKGKGKTLLIHQSKFKEFRDTVLNELENNINISHHYLKEASSSQIQKSTFNSDIEKIIYLSDFGQHISIVPVICYADIEIPLRTKRQIVAADEKGKEYLVKRNTRIEDEFVALLLKQHPDFTEQLDNPLQYFYLHKKRFLDEDWFLKAFEDWDAANITILGFDEITENKLNPQKAKVSIQVTSGVNWFNTDIDLRFGKKKASLKQLRQSIKSKSKFVRLDDGTMGIIPAEWIEKFTA